MQFLHNTGPTLIEECGQELYTGSLKTEEAKTFQSNLIHPRSHTQHQMASKSKSQGWQGEDVMAVYFPQWKPLVAHCEKPEPLWWDWRKHELQYALWANSSGEVLGLHRHPVPLQIPYDHLAVKYACLSMNRLHNDKRVCVCVHVWQ